MLRVWSALDHALQRLLASQNSCVLLLERAPETREALLLKRSNGVYPAQTCAVLTIVATRTAGLVRPQAFVRPAES